MTEQRRLAAIVVGRRRGLLAADGPRREWHLAALKAIRQEVVDPAIANHGGRIVKTTGDGLLLEFPSVVNAVRCAVEVQTAMADRTAEVRRGSAHCLPRSASTSATSLSMATTSLATASTSPLDFRRSRRLEGFAYRAGCMRMCATVSTRRSTTAAHRHSRTLLDRSRSGAGSPARR